MTVEVIHDISECERLWRKFSPGKNLFDLWEFKAPFLTAFKYTPYFLLAKEGDDERGIIPLWYVTEQKTYFLLGDTGDECHWQEENYFWVNDSDALGKLLENIPRPCVLNNLTSSAALSLQPYFEVSSANKKQFLDISAFHTPEDYLNFLPKKERSNLRGACRKIEALEPRIIENQLQNLKDLFNFNKKRFADSPLKDERLQKTFEILFKNGLESNSPYNSKLMAVYVGDKVAGVDLVFSFNEIYYPFLCGNNVVDFPGIGHFLNLKDIEDALSSKMKMIDFLESDPGSYKEKFFESKPQFKCLI